MVRIKDILKLENIIRVAPEDTLSHALAELSTSHDAGFVFSTDQKFLGLINPYYCLIRNSYPGNAKVEHCIFHPPRVYNNYPIDRLIKLMIESKLHYLPVFDEQERFVGIASARHLLFSMQQNKVFNITLADILAKKKKSVLSIYEDDFVSTAINLFKSHKTSKLVVISKDLKLRGILSYYDLIHFLISPKTKLHQGEKEGNKVGFQHQLIRNFAKTYVMTLSPKNTMADALKIVLEKKIGSIVVIDEQRHPLGIVTMQDFMHLLLRPEPYLNFELVNKNISEKNKQIVASFFERMYGQLKKVPELARAKLFVKEEKNGGLFEVVLSLIPKKGNPLIVKREGKNLFKLLKEMKEK